MTDHARIVEDLLERHGQTYAEAAGITLRDEPSPLYQLLVLTMLSSTRIGADLAVAAARELFAAGWRTPQRMRDATWQQRVDALGRAHYRRYDESTSTKLAEGADWLLATYAGDLRRLRPDRSRAGRAAGGGDRRDTPHRPGRGEDLLPRGAGPLARGGAVLRRPLAPGCRRPGAADRSATAWPGWPRRGRWHASQRP